MNNNSIRTPLAKVRGLGSAKDGTQHFIHQRITAILLVPLALWFVTSVVGIVVSGDISALTHWLSSGMHAGLTMFMLAALFYHAKLGVQVVVEDYVHCHCLKYTALLFNTFFMYGSALLSVIAVLKLHLHV